jgi:hypothetical protein
MPAVASVLIFQPAGAGTGVATRLSVGTSVGVALGTAVTLAVGHGVSVGLVVAVAECVGEAVGECCALGEAPVDEQAAATAKMAMVNPARYNARWMPMLALPIPRLMTVWSGPLDGRGLPCRYRDQREMESSQIGYAMA